MKEKRPAGNGLYFYYCTGRCHWWGLIIPVMPRLIAGMKHIPVNEASSYGGTLLMVYALMQFVFAPVLGNLSDKYGRRPVLLFSLFGFGLDYLLVAFAPSFGWFFVARIISGITGASFTTATAYIADISTAETRAKNLVCWARHLALVL